MDHLNIIPVASGQSLHLRVVPPDTGDIINHRLFVRAAHRDCDEGAD